MTKLGLRTPAPRHREPRVLNQSAGVVVAQRIGTISQDGDAPAVRLSAMSDDPAIRHGTIARIFDAVTTLALCALFVFAISVLTA